MLLVLFNTSLPSISPEFLVTTKLIVFILNVLSVFNYTTFNETENHHFWWLLLVIKPTYPNKIPSFSNELICNVLVLYYNMDMKYYKGHKHSELIKKKISETKRIYPDKECFCECCGSKFIFRTNKLKQKRRFCSKKCLYKIGGRFGISLSDNSKKILSDRYKGQGNPVWRGGISFKRKRLCVQDKHKKWRKKIFNRDGYTCCRCKKRNGYGVTVSLSADHILPFALCSEKEKWSMSNGQTLCKDCHLIKTKIENTIFWSNQYTKNNLSKKEKVEICNKFNPMFIANSDDFLSSQMFLL